MKEITLTQGKVALVDDSDFEYLNQFNWCVTIRNKVSYAIRRKGCKPGVIVYMHRDILSLSGYGSCVDHIDHNGLNNQRSNLRIANRSENGANKNKRENLSSKYLGVTFFNRDKKWIARIQKDGKAKHIGVFKTQEEAAIAYNRRSIELHGSFANLNKIVA